MTATWVTGAALAVVGAGVVACAGPRHVETTAERMCRTSGLPATDSYGKGFEAHGRARLVDAFPSTGNVLDSWEPTNQEHPTMSLWRGEADSRPMAACWFDGLNEVDYIVSAKLTTPSPRNAFFSSLPDALRGSFSR